jgi:putative sterol carrier protein
MSDAIRDFFDGLDRRGHAHLPKRITGKIRFDLEHDQRIDHWFVSIADGQFDVSRGEGAADAVIRTDQACFDRMVRGEVEPLSAWLRNDIAIDGKFLFLLLLRRFLPGPPGARHPRIGGRS